MLNAFPVLMNFPLTLCFSLRLSWDLSDATAFGEAHCDQSLIFFFFKLDFSLPALTDFYCFTILKEWAALIGVEMLHSSS